MSAGYTINPYALLLLQARVGQGQSLAEQSVQVTLKPARCSFAVAELYKYKRELDEGTEYSWDTSVQVTP